MFIAKFLTFRLRNPFAGGGVNVLFKPEQHLFQSFALRRKIAKIEIKTGLNPATAEFDLTHRADS